jgi:hypothetical protein
VSEFELELTLGSSWRVRGVYSFEYYAFVIVTLATLKELVLVKSI